MEENIALSYRLALSVVIMAFILALGLSVTMIASSYWNKIEYGATVQVVNTQSMTAYQLAQKNTPVPVAAIWKIMGEIDPYNTMCSTFVVYDKNGTRLVGGTYRAASAVGGVPMVGKATVETARKSLNQYLTKKAYFSYALNEANMYDIIINLAD